MESSHRIPDTAAISLPVDDHVEPIRKPGKLTIAWAQTMYIMRLANLNRHRSLFTYLTLLSALLFGLLTSFIWFQLPDSPSSASAVFRVITLNALYYTFTSNMGNFTVFSADRQARLTVLHGHRVPPAPIWYGRIIGNFPFHIFKIIIIGTLIYPIVGLRSGFGNYLLYQTTFMLQYFGNTALGMLCSAALPNPCHAVWLAALITSLNYIFSSVPYSAQQVTWILRWIRYLSPSFYADQMLVYNQFNGLTYPGTTITGNDILNETGWLKVPLSIAILGLLALGFIYNLLGFLLLKITSESGKK